MIIHMISYILDIIFFLGGAQNLSLPPGASYPRYATDDNFNKLEHFRKCTQKYNRYIVHFFSENFGGQK